MIGSTLLLALMTSSAGFVAAHGPPGPICSGTVTLNCYFCQHGNETSARDDTYCYNDEYWDNWAHWAHCSLWAAGTCVLG